MRAWDPLLAFEFLTVVRLRPWRPAAADAIARSQAFYPLVGVALGVALAAIDRVLAPLLPAGPRSTLLVAALVVATRGLHLDGLCDTFDGLLGGHDRAQRLEIMRDPRAGSYGVSAIVVVLLLKWSALAAMVAPVRVAALLVAPTLGRYAMVIVAAAAPYARDRGLGAGYHAAARGAPLFVATGSAAIVCLLALGWGGLTLLAAATLIAVAIASWSMHAVGGATGDVFGATCEITEVAVLMAALALGGRGWFDIWLVPE